MLSIKSSHNFGNTVLEKYNLFATALENAFTLNDLNNKVINN
jgi:hypothetical protein